MKVLIVEDEASIARRTSRILKEILKGPDAQIVIVPGVPEALQFINDNVIDLLLLDLNLSGQDGFQVLQSLMAESFSTIIISAYRARAIEAFEYGVVDFVAKPFDKARLEKAIGRFLDNNIRTDQPIKQLSIKRQGKILAIPVTDITYIQGANIYSEVFLFNNKKVLSNKSLDALIKFLPSNFERIHKSYIVDMSQCKEIIIEPGSKYHLRLNDDLLIPLGRTRYKDIKERYFNN